MPVTLNLVMQGNKTLIVTVAERETMEGSEAMKVKAYREELDLVGRVDRVIDRIYARDGKLYEPSGDPLPQDMADYIVKNMPYIVDGSSSIIQAFKFLSERKRTLSYAVNKDTIPYQEMEISDDAIMAILSMVFGKQNPSDTPEPEPADLDETLYRAPVPEDEDKEA